MRNLLTNDDGIDAPGLSALAEGLERIGYVRVITPAANQSAVGRGLSYGRMGSCRNRSVGTVDHAAESDEPFTVTVPYTDRERGYAVHGTPCDCIILGVNAFERPDLVVAGCNPRANLGAYVLTRSGTASAAAEAACLGVPGISLSMDTLGLDWGTLETEDFERACTVGRTVAERAIENDLFDSGGIEDEGIGNANVDDGIRYLNVNLPGPVRPLAGIEVTRPTPVYEMNTRFERGEFRLHNPLWAGMAANDMPDPAGTDRRAILDDRVSISSLSLPPRRSTGTFSHA